MEAAWGMVLGRLKTNIGKAIGSKTEMPPRARRRKPPPGAQAGASP
jgi:hypothetical protein